MGPGVQIQIEKLEAFREQSDAHQLGTDELSLGSLCIHIGGSLLLYLGNTGPFASPPSSSE
jgi:hypothetical protein